MIEFSFLSIYFTVLFMTQIAFEPRKFISNDTLNRKTNIWLTNSLSAKIELTMIDLVDKF